MIIAKITQLWRNGQVVCVPTNGFVKRSGEVVMEKGNALAMAKIIPELPRRLSDHIRTYGNHVGFIYSRIISFPVKPASGTYAMVLPKVSSLYKSGDIIPGFHCKASLEIITRSIRELNNLVSEQNIDHVFLPILSVESGLEYNKVMRLLPFLDRRVVITKF